MTPIWKDFTVVLGSADSIAYTIETDGVAIYSGIAVKRPGDTLTRATINNICAAYLHQTLPTLTLQGASTAPYVKTFDVKASGQLITSIEFVMDYSYDYGLLGYAHSLSDPVDGVIDYRMPLLRTNAEDSYTVQRYEADDTGGALQQRAYDESFDIFRPQAERTLADVAGNYVEHFTNADINAGFDWVGANEVTRYVVRDTCARYALYYVNAFGGWDALVMQGTPKHSEDIKRYNVQKSYDNSESRARGLHNYTNEITPKWALKTALLTDEQGARMHHLLGSTMVYLYDIETAEVLPVVITDNSIEYKTFKNNNRQRAQYTINVQLAAERLRR